jgi:uncharacterized protein DUF1569
MTNLFDRATAERLKNRLQVVRVDSPREWGVMNAAQTVAHCSAAMEMALGDTLPKRVFIGRILGTLVKSLALGNETPLRRNSPTAPELRVAPDGRDLNADRQRLCSLIDRFSSGGAAACTTHPHPFFGRLTPEQWAELMYKHVDHHLRQFGA